MLKNSASPRDFRASGTPGRLLTGTLVINGESDESVEKMFEIVASRQKKKDTFSGFLANVSPARAVKSYVKRQKSSDKIFILSIIQNVFFKYF